MSREHFSVDDDENTAVEVKGSEMWVEVWLWKLGGLGKVDESVVLVCDSGIEWCCVAISDTLLQTEITIRFPRSVRYYHI